MARRGASIFVLVLGLILLGDRASLLWQGSSSEQWPAVAGSVQTLEVKPMGLGRAGDGWRIQVVYRYRVNGEEFESDRLRFSKRFGGLDDESLAEARERFAAGNAVTVYHHPRQPSRSVLVPGLDPQAWMGLVLGVVLLIIAVVFWTVPTHSGRATKDPAGRPRR